MKNVSIVIGCILGLFILIFTVNEFEIFGVKFWGVRKETARREVFEQTQSYIEGKRQELSTLKMQYKLAKDSNDKEIIKNTILHNFANVDKSKLDYDSQMFLEELEN